MVDEDIIDEFERIGDLLDPVEDERIIKELMTIREEYNLTPLDLATKWDAYKYVNKINSDITLDLVMNLKKKIEKDHEDKIRREKLNENRRRMNMMSNQNNTFLTKKDTSNNIQFFDKSNMFDTMLDDDNNNKKRKDIMNYSTPKGPTKLRENDMIMPETNISPSIVSSPPTSTYYNRTRRNEIVDSFNNDAKDIKSIYEIKDQRLELSEFDVANRIVIKDLTKKLNIKHNFRYMYEEDDVKRDAINDKCEKMLDYMSIYLQNVNDEKQQNNQEVNIDEEIVSLHASNQDSQLFGGRIISLDDEKLNQHNNIGLEGDLSRSQGHQVKLKTGVLKKYELFPGQIVIGRGVNSYGNSIVVDEILKIPELPKYELDQALYQSYNQKLLKIPITMMIACGPFTPSSKDIDYGTSYCGLHDFIQLVNMNKPDIITLMGPFVDDRHPLLTPKSAALTARQRFAELINDILRLTKELIHLKILIVPSLHDLNSIPTYPQIPFELNINELHQDVQEDMSKLYFISNPSIIQINDITIAFNNIDVLKSLTKNELAINRTKEKSENRIIRLATHLLQQQSLYPVLAPKLDGITINYKQYHHYQLDFTPDLIICPSDVIKNIVAKVGQDSIFINPQTLIKYDTGGFYTNVCILPDINNEMDISNDDDQDDQTIQVKKMPITQRIRCEIKRI